MPQYVRDVAQCDVVEWIKRVHFEQQAEQVCLLENLEHLQTEAQMELVEEFE